MKPSRQLRGGLWLGILVSFALSGCVSDSWNDYVVTDYGPGQADRLCHPYWDCQQGEWERAGKSEIDMIVDYAECEHDLEPYGEWLNTMVVFGLEAGNCMKRKGYTLLFPNPLH